MSGSSLKHAELRFYVFAHSSVRPAAFDGHGGSGDLDEILMMGMKDPTNESAVPNFVTSTHPPATHPTEQREGLREKFCVSNFGTI